ncbi:MAG: hypothetical protein QOG16_883 [Actinomycetota bacterium]|nr:hypothetical protein [Actinomycetota bacterium]
MSVFIIPISQANLGGLTHVLTCKEQVEQPFTVVIPPDGGEPEMLSSLQITAEDTDTSLCGGLSVEPGVTLEGPGTMVMVVPIKNDSDFTWRGTVTLELDDTSIPVGIGEVPDHSTRTERVSFNLEEGTFELNGALSIGP